MTLASGGDLAIISRQDEATYHARSRNVSAQVTVGYGVSASGSYEQTKIDSDYRSVGEQSAILAGDGGYHLDIGGKTELTGAAILSSGEAREKGKNRLRTTAIHTRDLENHATTRGGSLAAGGGISVSGGALGQQQNGHLSDQGASGVHGDGLGYGHDSDRQHSITRSLLDPAALVLSGGNKNPKTTRSAPLGGLVPLDENIASATLSAHSGALKNRFDRGRMEKELGAQTQARRDFGRNAPQAVADLADHLGHRRAYENAAGIAEVAQQTLDNGRLNANERQYWQGRLTRARAQMTEHGAAYRRWGEGGTGRALLQAGVGGLLGGTAGSAVAAGATSLAAPALNRAGNALGGVGKGLLDLGAGAAIGAVSGGLPGAAAGANIDWHNRQLHPSEEQRIQTLAKEMAAQDHDALHLNEEQWAQRLRIAAASQIDARDNQIINAQLARHAWSHGLPSGEIYLQSLNSAAQVLKKEAARNTPLSWQDDSPILAYGEAVTAFEASDKQYGDHNLFGRLDASERIPPNLPMARLGFSEKPHSPANLLPPLSRYNGQEKEHHRELLQIASAHWENRKHYDYEKVLNHDYYAYTGTGEVLPSYPVVSLIGTGLGKAGAWAGKKVLSKGLPRLTGKEARQVGGRGLFQLGRGEIGKGVNKTAEGVKFTAKGMSNPKVKSAAAKGREAHKKFANRVRQKPGWKSEKTIIGPNGEKLRPDALTPSGRPVELKPNTMSGRKKGAKQIEKYKEATGTNGRVIYYDP